MTQGHLGNPDHVLGNEPSPQRSEVRKSESQKVRKSKPVVVRTVPPRNVPPRKRKSPRPKERRCLPVREDSHFLHGRGLSRQPSSRCRAPLSHRTARSASNPLASRF